MFRRRSTRRTRGQALVEFALAATLIFVLLSAAVDLGLIFFTMQELHAAAQEGATYGSHPTMVMNGAVLSSVEPPYLRIVDRVRHAAGTSPKGFANMLDLDNNGQDDSLQGGTVIDYTNPASFIYIENLKYSNDDLNSTPSTCTTTTARFDMRNAGKYCYVRVTVSYNYKMIFPLAPVFGDTIRLHSSFLIQVRSSFIG